MIDPLGLPALDIFENILAGYWDWNIQENTEYLSPRFKSMFGYKDHEMENAPEAWQKIIHPEDLHGVFEVFEKHVQTKGEFPYVNEVRYFHKDGSIVWVLCKGEVIEWDENGNPVRMVGCHVDITTQKKQEAIISTLKQKHEKDLLQLKTACEKGEIGVWTWNALDRSVTWDNTCYKLYGVSDPNQKITAESWANLIHPKDVKVVTRKYRQCMSNGEDFNAEYRILLPDGQIKHIVAFGYLIYNDNGDPETIMGTSRDVSPYYEIQRYQNLVLKLKRKNKELNEFAFIASHHLQEPIKNILGYSNFLSNFDNSNLSEEQKESLNEISVASEKLSERLNDLLYFSRIGDSGEKDKVDIQKLIQELDVYKDHYKSGKNKLILSGTPELNGSKKELTTLFQNLIENSLLYKVPDVPSKVEIQFINKGNQVIVVVQDNGIGIPRNRREAIFEMFKSYRLNENTETRKGMGLAVCRKIMDHIGGNISLNPEISSGSEFILTFNSQTA